MGRESSVRSKSRCNSPYSGKDDRSSVEPHSPPSTKNMHRNLFASIPPISNSHNSNGSVPHSTIFTEEISLSESTESAVFKDAGFKSPSGVEAADTTFASSVTLGGDDVGPSDGYVANSVSPSQLSDELTVNAALPCVLPSELSPTPLHTFVVGNNGVIVSRRSMPGQWDSPTSSVESDALPQTPLTPCPLEAQIITSHPAISGSAQGFNEGQVRCEACGRVSGEKIEINLNDMEGVRDIRFTILNGSSVQIYIN